MRYLCSASHCLGLLLVAGLSSQAVAETVCAYRDNSGQVHQVESQARAPAAFRARVICAEMSGSPIPKPSDVELEGLVRTASFVSDLGPIEVRWQRRDEACFGKSPSRAVADAAQSVNRALKSARFPLDVKTARRPWSLVFIDRRAALKQFPTYLAAGGHPGFMLPPNQIYLVTDFIVPDCKSGGVGDAFLAQVLLHEMGHVIEYLILGDRAPFERERAEGFASWFEQYSAGYSGVIPKGSVREYYHRLAKEALKTKASSFTGTPADYARAALKMQAVVDRRGISGLMEVYKTISAEQVPFDTAIERVLRWNKENMEREMKGALN